MTTTSIDAADLGLAPPPHPPASGGLRPTDEQIAIMDAARTQRESLMITAYAGTGKTTTLTMLSEVLPRAPALAAAFNVRIKKELEKRFPANFEVMTLNGLGHRAWARATGRRLEVDERKLGKLVSEAIKSSGGGDAGDDWANTRDLVTAAMQAGLVPEAKGVPRSGAALVPDTAEQWCDLAREGNVPPDAQERVVALARAVLIKSIQAAYAGVISYDEQIYCSTMLGGNFPRFPLMLVDEAQDLSPLNHIQVARVVGADGRLIVVGDPRQAIYAFRGADSSSMTTMRRLRGAWVELPLATTFRCPRVVVERQQTHAPGYRAHEGNVEGVFERLGEVPALGDADEVAWGYGDLERRASGKPIAMLCRNNAPLLSLAFKLLRAGVGVQMLGRDIGKSLVALATRLARDDATPAREVRKRVEDWHTREASLAEVNGKEHLIAGIDDRAECLLAVLDAEGVRDAGTLRRRLASLFESERGIVTLATGHRSKGFEWPLVVHLDPWRIPSRFAQRSAAQMKQERNLQYVIETRTMHTLCEANLEDFAS